MCFLQERHRALPGELGARLVEAAALVAMEAVAGDLIDVDLAVAAALLLDRLDVAHRDRLSVSPKCICAGHLRLLVRVLGDRPP